MSEYYLPSSSSSIYKCERRYDYTMVEEPTKEELQETTENMEKRYGESFAERMQERYGQHENILKHANDYPTVLCASCGCTIKLDPVGY